MNKMKNNETIELINYFHKAPFGKEIPFGKINAKAAPLGYLIHPECCTELVWDWLDTLTVDYNATFYKEWTDVLSRNRFELFLDQILHYASTYGTDFTQEGNGYVPNDGSISPDFKTLKVIEPISNEDLYKKCLEIITSGIALKDKTMRVLCDFIRSHGDVLTKGFIDSIKNKEAQAYLSILMGVRPSGEFGILRCLMYNFTGKCVLIKDKLTVKTIKYFTEEIRSDVINSLTDDECIALSRIFKRFKPLFLAMKTKKNAHKINHIRKLSDKNHAPLKIGFWGNIISSKRDISEIARRVTELDNFTKVRLVQCANVALYSQENSKVYNIRNGKVFTREDYHPKYDKEYLIALRDILVRSLTDSLSKKACRIRLPKWFDIKLPSSEKNFVGNYPFGTSIKLTENNVFGIYWKVSDGTNDFDFSAMCTDGSVISWCNNYYNGDNSIVFSGDMTRADPYATELLYVKNSCPDSILRVNQFCGTPKSRFRFFVANEEVDIGKFTKRDGYMVDPNNIKMDVMVDINNEPQKTLGLVHNNTITLMDLHSGNSIIGRRNKYGLEFIKTMCERTKCFVSLRDILISAGFEVVGDNEECDINFNNLEKDTLINLLK